jgi:hypothetical protein
VAHPTRSPWSRVGGPTGAIGRAFLADDVYPAILWPLDEPAVDGIPAEHVDLARRILSIHCDQRHGTADMIRVAEIAKPLLRL